MTTAPCPHCSQLPLVDKGLAAWLVYCESCFDGQVDGCNESGIDTVMEVAIDKWNDRVAKKEAQGGA